MLQGTELYRDNSLQVERAVMGFGELAAMNVRPYPRMLVESGNLAVGQLAVVTNAQVVPLLHGEIQGRSWYGAHPADIRVGGQYYSLSGDPDADRKAASLTRVDARQRLQELLDLPDALFEGDGSVIGVHRRSMHQLHLPGSDTNTVAENMRKLGLTGAVLMEYLDKVGALGLSIIPEGYVSWISGQVMAPGGFKDKEDSSVFGFGREPHEGAIPSPLGIMAMQILANQAHGLDTVHFIADEAMMKLARDEEDMQNLSAAVKATRADRHLESMLTRFVVIDVSDVQALIGSEVPDATSQYDLILANAWRGDRRIDIAPKHYNTPLAQAV